MNTPRRLVLLALPALFVAGCRNSDPAVFGDALPLSSSTVSLRRDVQPIFTARCAIAGCHAPSDASAGLVLATGRLFDPATGLVGVRSTESPDLFRVAPGDPGSSWLMRKLAGTQTLGDRMPLGDAPLPDAQLETIRQWIANGAHDD